MNHKHSIWRSDITGLRALAVIPVLIYHAWPQVMPGGFVGVDIFFVISGYLISGILFRELLQKGKIDYFNFYAKRIRPSNSYHCVGRKMGGLLAPWRNNRFFVHDARRLHPAIES